MILFKDCSALGSGLSGDTNKIKKTIHYNRLDSRTSYRTRVLCLLYQSSKRMNKLMKMMAFLLANDQSLMIF